MELHASPWQTYLNMQEAIDCELCTFKSQFDKVCAQAIWDVVTKNMTIMWFLDGQAGNALPTGTWYMETTDSFLMR